MSDRNCSSDPTSSCGDASGSLAAIISSSNTKITEKLTAIDTKVGNISTEIDECCTETNGNLTSIQTKLDTLTSNALSCCNAITSRLDTIAGLLESPVASGSHATFTDYVCQQTEA